MRLLSITAMRNEGPFLLEWLAYQRLIGFTDFLIFSNDCDDGTDLMLDALAAEGIVTHIRHSRPAEKSVQWQALNLAWRHPLRKAADWALFSDVDEFLRIDLGSGTLPELLASLPPEAAAIALPWRLFGTGRQHRFEDRPITQSFLSAAPYPLIHPIAGSYFKTLLRPSAFRAFGVHRPKRRKETAAPLWLNADLTPMSAAFAEADQRISLVGLHPAQPQLELHHYSLRSIESFIVKRARGLANRSVKTIDLSYFVERNFNSEPNTAMQRWAGPLAAEIAALKSLPKLAELHEAACQRHRETFAEAITQIDGFTLYAHCRHAGDSLALPPDEARKMLQAFQNVTWTR